MMQFTTDDLDGMIETMGGVDAEIYYGSQLVKTVQVIFKRKTEMQSAYNADELKIMPSIKCKTSDLDGIGRNHAVVIDGDRYRFYGDPEPANSGFSTAALVKA